jgi:hypothetical protein
VRHDGTRPQKKGTHVRPFLDQREPGGDDRDGRTGLPRAENVGEEVRESQVVQLDFHPFDRQKVPHRSSNQLEDDEKRGGPKGDGADPAPVPAASCDGGRLLVGPVLERFIRLSLHLSLFVKSIWYR